MPAKKTSIGVKAPKKRGTPLRDSVATRNAILDSAEKIFARDGLRSSRTEDIAAGSGVTKAMIHYYFDTKEALYQAVLDRVFQEREQGMEFASLTQLPPREALKAFVERLLQQMNAKPHIGPLFALENIQNNGAFYNKSGGKLYRVLTDIIARGVGDASFRPQDARHAAVNIVGACVHFFNISSNIHSLWPRTRTLAADNKESHKAAAVEFVLSAVGAEIAPRQKSRGARLAA
jgi:TetR/AcrR family transcriptional regulator